MSRVSSLRDLCRGTLRLGGAALLAVLLAACAAQPPPGTLPSPDPSAGEDETTPPSSGPRWTIRLHAGEDPGEAEEQASIARERFESPVSVQGAGGEYRVEVGEFVSEEDARDFLGIARERGFPGASIRPLDHPSGASEAPPEGH